MIGKSKADYINKIPFMQVLTVWTTAVFFKHERIMNFWLTYAKTKDRFFGARLPITIHLC